jgi:hypothetical protein
VNETGQTIVLEGTTGTLKFFSASCEPSIVIDSDAINGLASQTYPGIEMIGGGLISYTLNSATSPGTASITACKDSPQFLINDDNCLFSATLHNSVPEFSLRILDNT